MAKCWITAILLLVATLAPPAVQAERIKDIATVQGVRPNQLLGYGIVVGLDGSGDQTTQTPFTVQSMNSMLAQLGVNLPPGTSLQLKNVAAVMVTSLLPAFAKPGQALDVTVSSMGNAKSLRGGTLLLTPLKGADGQVYAMAQGNIVVAGAGASAGGSKTQVNHLSAGRVPSGATVERAVATALGQGEFVYFELNTTDFGTARRVEETVNAEYGMSTASAVDARVIRLRAPVDAAERVGFIAAVENMDIELGVAPAKVIINSRTGSVVMNQAVRLEPSAVAHGNLTVTINSTPVISQPAPLSEGKTVATEKADIQVKQEGNGFALLGGGAKLADVVKALNALGANPQDLVAILQALKAAGALRAELEII
jgi:flagellar P-ring protein FlgI